VLSRLAGRRLVALVRAIGVVDDLVDSPRGDGRGRAQRALTGGKPERRAIGRDRGPPVQDVGPPHGQGKAVARQHRDGHVAGHRNGEARDGYAEVPEPAPPATGDQDREDDRRDDEHLTDLPHVGGQAQHQGAGREPPHGRPGLPEQDGEPGDDEGFEGDVGHDGLFRLELVSVQQERGGGEGGGPAGGVTPDQGGIEGDGHAQAEQVLKAGHHGQISRPQQRLEQDVVTRRVVPAGARQVRVRIDVEQDGPVSQLGDHAQPQPGRQHDDQQPVPAADTREAPDAPGRRGRLICHPRGRIGRCRADFCRTDVARSRRDCGRRRAHRQADRFLEHALSLKIQLCPLWDFLRAASKPQLRAVISVTFAIMDDGRRRQAPCREECFVATVSAGGGTRCSHAPDPVNSSRRPLWRHAALAQSVRATHS
jgi:hypothetical protein